MRIGLFERGFLEVILRDPVGVDDLTAEVPFVEAAALDVGRGMGFVFSSASNRPEVAEGLQFRPHLRAEFFSGASGRRPLQVAQAVRVSL